MDFGNHFYVTLFSNTSQKTYPDNTLADFTVQLPHRIDLGSTDRWDVGLCKFSCSPFYVGMALIYCDLIMPQFMGSQYIRCLRTLPKYDEHTFKNVYYMPVERRAFQTISIVIAHIHGDKIPFKPSDVPTNVVLHFKNI
jgi:hypothetical protein